MISSKQYLILMCLILCFSQCGCQLLQLPFQLVSSVFNLAGQALQVADSLPKPPPGVFF